MNIQNFRYSINSINYYSNNLKKLSDVAQSTNKRCSKFENIHEIRSCQKNSRKSLNFQPPKISSPLNTFLQ